MRAEIRNNLSAVIPPGRLRFKESLRPYTTMGTGGFADVLLAPANLNQMCTAIQMLRTERNVQVIGGGHTVLPSDKGFKGAVLQTGAIKYIDSYDEYMTVYAGNTLDEIARAALQAGQGGAEWGAGSGRTLGGIIAGGSTAERLLLAPLLYVVEIITKDGDLITLRAEELQQKAFAQKRFTVCRAILKLYKGDRDTMEEIMCPYIETQERREAISEYRIGPIFGERSGGMPLETVLENARVSELKLPDGTGGFCAEAPNMIFGSEQTTAQAVADLIQEASARVLAQTEIRLHSSIKYIGTWFCKVKMKNQEFLRQTLGLMQPQPPHKRMGA